MELWKIRERASWLLFRSGLPRLLGRRPTLVLGDSHMGVFKGWAPTGRWIFTEWVGGATASGIVNPNSATQALPRFRERLAGVRRGHDVAVCLGEVDCGYVIWRRAQRDEVAVDDQLTSTVDGYRRFLAEVRASGCRRVLVLAAPLPTLPDDSDGWGEVAQKRSDVTVSQRDRTDLTLRFNEQLREVCAADGMAFVDTSTPQLDETTGLVRGDLLRHGQGDHHLLDEPFREIISSVLPRP